MNTVSIESFVETQDNVAKKAVATVTPTDEIID